MRIFALIVLFFVSCSSVTERSSSAEIAIDSAEKVLQSMPASPEKTIVSNALKQAKAEKKEDQKIINDLSKKKEKAESIAQTKSEQAGEWKGIRNVALFIASVLILYVIYTILKKRGLI
ncbi:MAG: hypothetical protein IT569_05330 [Leptospiraceae bacterium]|nr:hypothetical protein [Leptospiraceae bacterium]